MITRLLMTLACTVSFTASAVPCILIGGPAAIDAKHAAKSFLGAPQSEATMTPARDGCYRNYDGGSIYWLVNAPEAFEVHGDIRWQWANVGWEQSWLGYPVTDETVTPDGVGRFTHFQRGSIYWKPELGAHAVINGFRAYWAERGWERNAALGYPLNSELAPIARPLDRFQDFENGVLFFANRTGAIDELWPFPMASRSKEDLEIELGGVVDGLLARAGGEAYREGEVVIEGVTGYRRNGQGAPFNRALVAKIHVKYTAAFLGIDDALPDPSSDIRLTLRLDGRRRFEGDALLYSVLEGWSASTHVPFPTSTFISAGTINNRLRGELDPLVGSEQELAVLPAPLTLLVAKVTAEGGLSVYVAPLD